MQTKLYAEMHSRDQSNYKTTHNISELNFSMDTISGSIQQQGTTAGNGIYSFGVHQYGNEISQPCHFPHENLSHCCSQDLQMFQETSRLQPCVRMEEGEPVSGFELSSGIRSQEDPLPVGNEDNIWQSLDLMLLDEELINKVFQAQHATTSSGKKQFDSFAQREQFLHESYIPQQENNGPWQTQFVSNEPCEGIYQDPVMQRESIPIEGSQFICSICKRRFTSEEFLEHEKIHTIKETYSYNTCHKSFTQTNDILQHLKSHTEKKPFLCVECGKRFSRKYSLKVHKRTHTDERPYKCDLCESAFSHLKSLKNHQRTHSGERPYTCDYCEYAAAQSSTLKGHVMRCYKRHKCSSSENSRIRLHQTTNR